MCVCTHKFVHPFQYVSEQHRRFTLCQYMHVGFVCLLSFERVCKCVQWLEISFISTSTWALQQRDAATSVSRVSVLTNDNTPCLMAATSCDTGSVDLHTQTHNCASLTCWSRLIHGLLVRFLFPTVGFHLSETTSRQ